VETGGGLSEGIRVITLTSKKEGEDSEGRQKAGQTGDIMGGKKGILEGLAAIGLLGT